MTGQADYTDDIRLRGMVHAAILRSPHAHAKINSIDTSAARNAPGVLAVYTGADTDGVLNPIPCAWLPPDSDIKAVDHPAMAVDTVRYVGDAVAVVVAESRYQAEDALELINVDYSALPSVVNPQARHNFTKTPLTTRHFIGLLPEVTLTLPSRRRREIPKTTWWLAKTSFNKG